MDNFNLFNFRFGKIKRKFSYYVKVGFLLNLTVNVLDFIPGVSERSAFNVIDRTQQFLGVDALNDYIVKDDKFIGYRIERVLDDAIEQAIKKNI